MINNSPENIILKEIEELKRENSKLKIELEAFKLTQGSTPCPLASGTSSPRMVASTTSSI